MVTISGTCQSIYSYYANVTREKIIEVLQWGKTGLKYIYLGNCENLRKIASPSVNSFKYLYENGLENAFMSCTAFTEIPSDLFANCPQITSFNGTFYGCTSLKNIPQNLFDNCQNVINFIWTFGDCTDLTGEAPELWTRGTNTEENSYQGNPDGVNCFEGCTNLSNYDLIPQYWKDSHE